MKGGRKQKQKQKIEPQIGDSRKRKVKVGDVEWLIVWLTRRWGLKERSRTKVFGRSLIPSPELLHFLTTSPPHHHPPLLFEPLRSSCICRGINKTTRASISSQDFLTITRSTHRRHVRRTALVWIAPPLPVTQ